MRCSVILTANFNPRSHKGSDEDFIDLAERLVISIHAPTRGATPIISVSKCEDVISIHAPTRGATVGSTIYITDVYGFQSTLPQGERRNYCINDVQGLWISIHAPTRGATAILHKIPYLFYFIFTNPFPISYFHTQPASDF